MLRIYGCIGLFFLILAGCQTKTPLEKVLSYPPDVTKINLSYSFMDSLPEEIGIYSELRVLRLFRNRFVTLPEEIGNLKKLEILVLSSNNLEKLPASIGNLTNVNELSLQYNNLRSLPAEIGK